jgi:hypothetical protein
MDARAKVDALSMHGPGQESDEQEDQTAARHA